MCICVRVTCTFGHSQKEKYGHDLCIANSLIKSMNKAYYNRNKQAKKLKLTIFISVLIK